MLSERTPELMALAGGLAFSLAVFAVKAATGQYWLLAGPGSRRNRAMASLACAAAYVAAFFAAYGLIRRFDAWQLAMDAKWFFAAGVPLHVLLSAGLVIWGMALLAGPSSGPTAPENRPKGWLLLALPCPVCASAIFLSSAFLLLLFPAAGWLVPAAAAGFFLAVLYGTVALLLLGTARFRQAPTAVTGKLMIGIGLYFLLLLLVAPRFREIELGWKLAGHRRETPESAWLPLTAAAVTVLAGFFRQMWLYHKRK